VILAEFSLGVVGPIALGVFTWSRASSPSGAWFGAYLVCLGMNYVPPLAHGIDITRRGTALDEIGDETDDRRQLFRKYRRQSLFLLLPFVVPTAAVAQWRAQRRG
jgi:hypothetical protein